MSKDNLKSVTLMSPKGKEERKAQLRLIGLIQKGNIVQGTRDTFPASWNQYEVVQADPIQLRRIKS